jgi:hypothetical protein
MLGAQLAQISLESPIADFVVVIVVCCRDVLGGNHIQAKVLAHFTLDVEGSYFHSLLDCRSFFGDDALRLVGGSLVTSVSSQSEPHQVPTSVQNLTTSKL